MYMPSLRISVFRPKSFLGKVLLVSLRLELMCVYSKD